MHYFCLKSSFSSLYDFLIAQISSFSSPFSFCKSVTSRTSSFTFLAIVSQLNDYSSVFISSTILLCSDSLMVTIVVNPKWREPLLFYSTAIGIAVAVKLHRWSEMSRPFSNYLFDDLSDRVISVVNLLLCTALWLNPFIVFVYSLVESFWKSASFRCAEYLECIC